VTLALRNIRTVSEEFAAAVRWYENHQVGLGVEFFDAVSISIDLISERPDVAAQLTLAG